MAASELPGLQLALKGRSTYVSQCLLIGHGRTCRERALTAEFDPFRTFELDPAGAAFEPRE